MIALVFGLIFEVVVQNLFWGYNIQGSIILMTIVWAFSLTGMYYLIKRLMKKKDNLAPLLIFVIYVPVIILIEWMGRIVLGIQIDKIYPCLVGNFMCAPVIYYAFVYFWALWFWYSVRN